MKLGISFLTSNNLKLICMENEVALMPVKDGSALRARLEDGGCNNFTNWRSGKVWRATEEQKISTHVWRIPHERTNINVLKEKVEKIVGV